MKPSVVGRKAECRSWRSDYIEEVIRGRQETTVSNFVIIRFSIENNKPKLWGVYTALREVTTRALVAVVNRTGKFAGEIRCKNSMCSSTNANRPIICGVADMNME